MNNDETHICRFFAFKIKADFEPIVLEGETLYERVEYLISGCSCGRSVSSRITAV